MDQLRTKQASKPLPWPAQELTACGHCCPTATVRQISAYWLTHCGSVPFHAWAGCFARETFRFSHTSDLWHMPLACTQSCVLSRVWHHLQVEEACWRVVSDNSLLPFVMQRLRSAAGPVQSAMTSLHGAAPPADSSPGAAEPATGTGDSEGLTGCQALSWLLAALSLGEAAAR